MACRSIGTGTGSEGLAALRIMAYVSWPWSAKGHKIGIERYSFGRNMGWNQTIEAFQVKRRTLYYWRSQLREGNESIESLNEKSRAPRKRRKRLGPKEVYEEIRRLRAMHPNLSKEKLYPFVQVFCETKKLSCPKPRTIGRLIADAPDKMRSRPAKLGPKAQRLEKKKTPKGRKPKGYKAAAPGECGAFDTVEYFFE